MTNVFKEYNFMDLLKDYNYVPEAEKSVIEFPENVAALVEFFTDMIKNSTTDYTFLDLLGDKGYVPVNDNWVKAIKDNNEEIIKIAC